MNSSSNAVLVCSSPNAVHDSCFVAARLREVLGALAPAAQVRLLPDYSDIESIVAADVLISYIAERSPSDAECSAVGRFIERGGRWFAIHTSNWVDVGCNLPSVIGSRFITHPPYGPFTVHASQPSDPLVAGIESFEVEDELYVIEQAEDIEVLLHARWGGPGPRGEEIAEAVRPMLYRRKAGAGEVLYLALGHTNAAGAVPERRGSWQSPVFQELVRRGVAWALDPAGASDLKLSPGLTAHPEALEGEQRRRG